MVTGRIRRAARASAANSSWSVGFTPSRRMPSRRCSSGAPIAGLSPAFGVPARRALGAAQESRHFVERPLRRGQPDALQRSSASLQRQSPCARSASSRSSDSARCAPRLPGTSA